MSFTRAKNPLQDSGFNLLNFKGTAGDLVGYGLFGLAIAAVWSIVRDPGESLGNRVRNMIGSLLGMASETGGPNISVN